MTGFKKNERDIFFNLNIQNAQGQASNFGGNSIFFKKDYKMKKILIFVLLVLCCFVSAYGGEFEDTLKRAEQGDVEAQNSLGYMYCNGKGVPKDYKQAAYWYTKAAEQGSSNAQLYLGLGHNMGVFGLSKNSKKAVYWYTKAAEQGSSNAQNSLGYMYCNGKGVPKDYKQAAYWYTKAAEQGSSNAQLYLGTLYSEGKGILQNHKKAVYWYTKAAELGNIFSQYNLGVMHYNGLGVTQNYKFAYIWFSLAATGGHEDARKNRDIASQKLSPQRLGEAQELSSKMQTQIEQRLQNQIDSLWP